MSIKRLLAGLFLATSTFSHYSYGADNHVIGNITNITSTSSGLLIRIGDLIVPGNCTSGRKWMEIRQSKTAMTSLTITAWTLGLEVVVYTAPGSNGFCEVTQVDPRQP